MNRIVAVGADIQVENDRVNVKVQSLQNDDIMAKYKISVSLDGGEYKTIFEYSSKKEYSFEKPDDTTAMSVKMEARNGEDLSAETAFQVYDISL